MVTRKKKDKKLHLLEIAGVVLYEMKSETGEIFEEFTHIEESGEPFLYASTVAEGSGAFRTEAIFWISPDKAFQTRLFLAKKESERRYGNKTFRSDLQIVKSLTVNEPGN